MLEIIAIGVLLIVGLLATDTGMPVMYVIVRIACVAAMVTGIWIEWHAHKLPRGQRAAFILFLSAAALWTTLDILRVIFR